MTATLERPRTGGSPVVRRRKQSWQRTLYWVATHALGIAMGVMFTLPVLLVLLTSFMQSDQAMTASIWPDVWHIENFAEVFKRAPMLTYMLNSLLYSLLATLGILLSAVPAAYALAKLKWRGQNLAFMLVVVAMMLPPQVTIVPLFDLWVRMGLTGTLVPLIVPYFLFDAFSIFLLRQFFLTIPKDYLDAAKIDGCSEFRVLTRVVVPMAKPGIAAAAMFCFLFTWNDYFGPLLYTAENRDSWTLSLAIASFRGMHHVEWNLTMAATVLTLLPAIVLFVVAQKSLVKGITFTGVKG
ncbi:carbohydrate ABC transporter permease [Kibdelosporangium phytohabitans]|uniref:Sugar ABC transporter permease n=1 Tax=Kibdelosporangium phytohabitans TaxID=860235 RepID=A0A0N9HYW2_9PSEU|nr:carbohydrate ABC transporter permease [Kibdelosporangium phytohabitans]ALG08932.1 sugar ABC transporter permease [Kibdelosporangium phytohabitans]MBE1469907.1 multiple sugar transport system permease protein [Kibdelosporangium phytohabitans]